MAVRLETGPGRGDTAEMDGFVGVGIAGIEALEVPPSQPEAVAPPERPALLNDIRRAVMGETVDLRTGAAAQEGVDVFTSAVL